MTIEQADFINVSDRVEELRCHFPNGLAVMPENFETAQSSQDFQVRGEASTLRTIFRNANLPLDSFQAAGERPKYIHNKSFDWGAALFVSASLLSNDPNAVAVALGMISTFLSDYFKGTGGKVVKLSIVVEKKKGRTCKKLTYEGDVAGLGALKDAVLRIADE